MNICRYRLEDFESESIIACYTYLYLISPEFTRIQRPSCRLTQYTSHSPA